MNILNKYNKAIEHYYDSSQLLYSIFCYNSSSLGMHYGFWDEKTKNRHEAMENENQAIIDLAHITARDQVLDAGCGVGGTAIYIAQKTGAKVIGITLSQNQVNLAKKYALKKGVSDLTDFQVQDYTKTNFPGNSFDVIYGIESICYAYPKKSFFKEAFRILKPGGKLVMADGYSGRKPASKEEEKILNDFNVSFALKEMALYKDISDSLLKLGFIKVKAENRIESVRKSVKQFSSLSYLALPIAKLLVFFPLPIFQALKRNSIALISAEKAIKIGLFTHYTHYAQKPQNPKIDS